MSKCQADSVQELKYSTARLKESTARLKDSTVGLKDRIARLEDSTARMRGEQADIDMAILGVGLFSFFFELLFLTCDYWMMSPCCRTEMRSARSPVAYSSTGLETNWLSCVGILTGKLGRSVTWQREMSLLLETQCSQRRR